MNTAIAVKGFILNDKQEVLLIKRRENDVHAAGKWEIPGGRLDLGENPFTGLQREVQEEVGLEIENLVPLKVDYFTRDDGQIITMIIFLCRKISGDVRLSEEHCDFTWNKGSSVRDTICKEFHSVVDNYEKYFLDLK